MSGLAVEKIADIITSSEVDGVKTGKIVNIDPSGSVFINFKDNRQGPIRARLTSAAAESINKANDWIDTAVLVAFEENDISRPVIIDVIRDRIAPDPSSMDLERNHLDDVQIDGETITFDAKKQIVLRCGKSSITLTRAGKVLIRGAYLLNRSSGVNRIKGGSVHIN